MGKVVGLFMLIRRSYLLKTKLIFAIITLGVLANDSFRFFQNTSAHSSIAYPTEIFSIWNGTNPTINGSIHFTFQGVADEWVYAAVYDMYDSSNAMGGKLLLQNDNASLYVAIDATNFQVLTPIAEWGTTIYFDIDHNGVLSSTDKSIRFISNSTDDYVEYRQYNELLSRWNVIEWRNPGMTLPVTGIYFDTAFTTSAFDNITNHRQYEIKIPFTAISSGPGNSSGIAFEATDDYSDQYAAITWPYIADNLLEIRTNANEWGDVSFGESSKDDFDYVVEQNMNVKSSALGYNNGTYITSGDIDGNGDQEIIVSSNRTVLGDDNLLAIFDYNGAEFQRIWSSWTTSHQSIITFPIKGIKTYDFDGDGKDEIYAVGESTRILRFSEWNSTSNDFDTSEIIFTHSYSLMGYLTIGDGNNDSLADLVFGDQNGYVSVLEYNSLSDSFSHDFRSPFRFRINLVYPYRIHVLTVGDIDNDMQNEILFNYQVTADDQISSTQLLIYERSVAKYLDNPADDLPAGSSTTTADQFGHIILVADVDNDLDMETIMVGKDYLKIFEQYSFSDPTPPLQISLNDGLSKPSMSGGAALADLDDDGINELIFGANNGTLYIGHVTDLGSSLSFSLNWSGDFGSSLGFHGAITTGDFDGDGRTEFIVGDNYGQILVFGKGEAPQISITSPSSGYVSSRDNVLVTWSASDDLQTVHHFDVYVDGGFTNRVGGGQTSIVAYLTPGQNIIEVIAFDFSGLSKNTSVIVKFDVDAPQVTITSPENYFMTDLGSVQITFDINDPDNDFDTYEIYRNSTLLKNSSIIEPYDVVLPSDGIWNITVIAVDVTLLKGRESVFVIKDTTPPSISITSPLDGSAFKNTELDIIWSASDELTDIDYYEVYVDGGYIDTTTLKTYTVLLAVDKDFTIAVRAYDLLGNFQSDTITVTRDRVDPLIEIDPLALPTLADGTFYTDNPFLSLTWNATDNLLGSGISHTQIIINGLLYDTYTPSTTTDIVDLGDDSFKDIFVRTYDEAGNFEEDYVAVILDRTNPELSINNPVNNFTTGLDYVIISWYAHDAGVGIKEQVVLVDGVVENIITDPTIRFYQISIPDTKTYLIIIRIIDILDHFIEQSINVTHDPNAPTIMIINPSSVTDYSNTMTVDLTWDIINMDVSVFEIYINGTYYDNYTSGTINAVVNLPVNPYEYPLFNLTIIAITTDMKVYQDYRWIIVDQTDPVVSIIDPLDDDIITLSSLQIEWFSYDDGSGLERLEIHIDDLVLLKDEASISHVLDITGYDGTYDLLVYAFDIAGNNAFDIVTIEISLLPPDFTTSLEPLTICNDLNMQFNLSIYNPRLGVKTVTVIADSVNDVYSVDYALDYVTSPIWILINVTQSDFLDGLVNHNLTINVYDRANRASKEVYDIILDEVYPVFWQNPVIDNSILSNTLFEITLDEEGNNYHNITIYIKEEYGLSNVTLTITGLNYSETFCMICVGERATSPLYQYTIQLNFDNFETGDYQLVFNFTDVAGNSNSAIYNMRINEEIILDTRNPLIYVIIGVVLTVIVAIVLAISLRKPISNIGWRDELVVVSYILNSGLTTIFVPYSPEIITDEQLFGGALTGIRGILEEIIGTKSEFEVEVFEFGEKHLLNYSGLFGDCILIVKKLKPIHVRTLSFFADDFEKQYSEVLDDDTHVTEEEYKGSEELVEKYFGKRFNLERIAFRLPRAEREKLHRKLQDEMIDQDTVISSFYGEIITKYEKFDELPSKTKNFVGDAIILAEQALTELISYEFKHAKRSAKASLESLEKARKTKEPLDKYLQILDTIQKIVEKVLEGAYHGKRGRIEELHKAIEVASQLFLSQITSLSELDR